MAPKTTPYSIAQTVRDRADEFGNNPVFSYKDEELSYVDFHNNSCLLYTSPSPRDQRGSRMPSSA